MSRLSASAAMRTAAAERAVIDPIARRERQDEARRLESAAATRAAHIAAFPCATRDEAVRVLRALARETCHRLGEMMGPQETASLFESLARRELRLGGGRAAARAEAEKLFAANDREAGE